VQPVDAMHARQFRAAVEAAGGRAARVLIDTPPGFSDPALLAALCADLVLLPAGPSPLDILAAARDALAVAREARTQRGGDKPLIRFVPSMVTRTTLGRDQFHKFRTPQIIDPKGIFDHWSDKMGALLRQNGV
jgi:cellulose biosynthesis protein BcsQ